MQNCRVKVLHIFFNMRGEYCFRLFFPDTSGIGQDAFYHLNKQVLLALDFCMLTKKYLLEEKEKLSLLILGLWHPASIALLTNYIFYRYPSCQEL